MLTDVKGLILDDALVSRLSVNQAEASMKQIGPGMITKVYAAVEAVKNGVGEAIIASGFSDSPLTGALGHNECTVISK